MDRREGGKKGGRMNMICSKLEQIGEWVSVVSQQ